MDNIQNISNFIKIPSSQTFSSQITIGWKIHLAEKNTAEISNYFRNKAQLRRWGESNIPVLNKHHTLKTCGEVRCKSMHS
jgi:hypothetical protein